jgi:hypothetical protein
VFFNRLLRHYLEDLLFQKYRTTEAAIAALRDSMDEDMGMEMALAFSSSGTPCPSRPGSRRNRSEKV